MKNTKFLSGIIFISFLWSCSPKAAEEAPACDSVATMISSSAAIENESDTTHKFVRTADLKFKVKNVIKSTYNIEDITNHIGGFVTYTNLYSENTSEKREDISADSSVIITNFTVINNITIRVPNTKLDTVLKMISRNIVFLDYRIIKADDVALQLLSNELSIRRYKNNEKRLKNAIDNRGKKLGETSNAEDLLLNKQEQADNALINNLSLKDQINFSTINLIIYQNQGTNYEKVARYDNSGMYKPGFGYRVWDSISNGWDIFENIIVFIINLWGIFLIGIIAYILYKIYKNKIKDRKNN